MHIGKFDRRIEIILNNEEGYTTDEYGGQTTAVIPSSDPVKVYAEIKQDNGSESTQSGKVTTSQSVLFILRYLAGITVHSRIIYDDKTYVVESFREVYGRKRFLELKTRLIDGSQ